MSDFDKENSEPFSNPKDRVYFSAPDAKTDEGLRKTIKDAGARWDNSYKCWYYVPGAVNDENILKSFEQVDPNTMTRIVDKYLQISKEELSDPVKAALRENRAKFDYDQKLWKVNEINGEIPAALQGFKTVPYDDLQKKVFVEVPAELKGKEELHDKYPGISWDYQHESYYFMMSKKEQTPEEIKGLKVCEPENLQKKPVYLKVPEAKTSKEFRKKIKDAGAHWSSDYQCWMFVTTKNNPLPDVLKNSEIVPKANLVKHVRMDFKIPLAAKSEELREKLHQANAHFSDESKTWTYYKPENSELPEILKNYETVEVENEQKRVNTKKQSQGIHR